MILWEAFGRSSDLSDGPLWGLLRISLYWHSILFIKTIINWIMQKIFRPIPASYMTNPPSNTIRSYNIYSKNSFSNSHAPWPRRQTLNIIQPNNNHSLHFLQSHSHLIFLDNWCSYVNVTVLIWTICCI